MSRTQWASYSESRHNEVDVDVDKFRHVPLAPKTSDPEALKFDKASEIFLTGLRNARNGNLKTACEQIATAFLLDERSIKFAPILPPSASKEMEFLMLDAMLLYKLSEVAEQDYSNGSDVFNLMGGFLFGHKEGGQETIAETMQSIENLIGWLEKKPWIEHPDSGILGGYLTRARLYYLRSSLQMTMGNIKKAVKDLSSSLKCDPCYTKAREGRASLWSSYNLKSDAVIHREYLRVMKESHPDDRSLEIIYARLAVTTLRDPTLGTLAEAKEYYKKSIQASLRHREIYGKKQNTDEAISLLKAEFQKLKKDPSATKMREDLDKLAANKTENGESILKAMDVPLGDKKHLCLKCGKKEQEDGSKLMKCSRCKSVSYCSRQCQAKDWKEHKTYCEMTATKP
ncbi:hypothetical protein CTEN210_08792 [Chaetoceros tenuissimus]|uniref:MYND-type domain-containing protein n=1 Tax=Chaetoceros tenuissimus TaxID=426638 RepID=A0AAD3CU63_9STRA|nr:hypothetical protein CTEN210_08792 [Chaetoceros tenuissimus]